MNPASIRLPMPGPAFGPYPERGVGTAPQAPRRWLPVGAPDAAPGRFAAQVRQAQQDVPAVGSAAFVAHVRALRAELGLQGLTGDVLAQAFGVVLAATQDTLGLQLFDTQVQAARVLLDNRLAEMATGEGKTHAAMLAAATAALAGVPVHVVTANAYLAVRDATALAPLYAALGLQVAAARPGEAEERRRMVWRADVAYTTARDLIFDYLRDRQRPEGHPPLLRGLCMALIDEADSVLIDEARTPFILAQENQDAPTLRRLRAALAAARRLQLGVHFSVELPTQRAHLTPAGALACPADAGPARDTLWAHDHHRQELVQTALAALHIYRPGQHYLVQDGRLEIIDPNTGRVTPGRRWSGGLHQLVELTQGLQPSPEQHTTAQMSFQRFFTRYWRLCGTSGTLAEARAELLHSYGLAVRPLPLRLPSQRRHLGRHLFVQDNLRWAAVVRTVAAAHGKGQPVLVACDSIADADRVCTLLQTLGLRHQRLDARLGASFDASSDTRQMARLRAKPPARPAAQQPAVHPDINRYAQEAQCVARAGALGAITVATRMAGRGTDIRLGEGVAQLGGLLVIDAQANGSARIDRQLHGRCARGGEPGQVMCLQSLQSALFLQELHPWVHTAVRRLLQLLAALPLPQRNPPCAAPGWLATPLLRLVQARVQTREKRQRLALAQHDEQINRQLGFGGRFE